MTTRIYLIKDKNHGGVKTPFLNNVKNKSDTLYYSDIRIGKIRDDKFIIDLKILPIYEKLMSYNIPLAIVKYLIIAKIDKLVINVMSLNIQYIISLNTLLIFKSNFKVKVYGKYRWTVCDQYAIPLFLLNGHSIRDFIREVFKDNSMLSMWSKRRTYIDGEYIQN